MFHWVSIKRCKCKIYVLKSTEYGVLLSYFQERKQKQKHNRNEEILERQVKQVVQFYHLSVDAG